MQRAGLILVETVIDRAGVDVVPDKDIPAVELIGSAEGRRIRDVDLGDGSPDVVKSPGNSVACNKIANKIARIVYSQDVCIEGTGDVIFSVGVSTQEKAVKGPGADKIVAANRSGIIDAAALGEVCVIVRLI